MYRIVEADDVWGGEADAVELEEPDDASRVAASGECGGGLGAVAPAVGEDGPQQVAGTVVPDDDDDEPVPELVDAGDGDWLVAVLDGASPTTSISSSSSRTSTMTCGGGGGEGDPEGEGSSTRSGHG